MWHDASVKSAPELADADLVRLVLAQDPDAFGTLVERYRVRLYRFVERYTNDSEDARDVTQEVFLKVHAALDSYDPKYKFSTWLFRIAGNAAIDHLRRRKARPLPLELPRDEDGESRVAEPRETRPDPFQDLARRRLRDALAAAIDRLPDDYRELISLRHYGELPYEEIADVLDTTLPAVKSLVHRATVAAAAALAHHAAPTRVESR